MGMNLKTRLNSVYRRLPAIMAHCRASSLRVLAITQMVIGALVIIFGILCVLTVRHWTSYIGFWYLEPEFG